MNVFKFLNRKFRENPVLLYLVFFFLIMLGTYYLFSYCGLSETNSESARYMLSALVQSEAAIIAIVVTLSLVAVQISASSYSPRVTGIFRKSLHLWVLMVSYIVSMIYSIIVLKMIGEYPTLRAQQFHVNGACFLGIFCFAALLPYAHKILYMLEPSNIAAELAQNLTKNSFLTEKSPLHDVFEIIENSVRRKDYETVRNTLKTLRNEICRILEDYSYNKYEEKKAKKTILSDFRRITLLLTQEEAHAAQAVQMIADISFSAIGKELEIVAGATIFLLSLIVENIVKKRFIWVAVEVEISELREIADAANKKELPDLVENVFFALREIALSSLQKYPRSSRKEDRRHEIHAAMDVLDILQKYVSETTNEKLHHQAQSYYDDIDCRIKELTKN